MTVHFFVFSDRTAPSSRQRGYGIAERLRERGIETVIHEPTVLSMSRTPWPGKARLIAALVRSLSSIKADDIVFLQRTVYNKYFFAIMVVYLKLFRRSMIFDFDDPIYTHNYLKTKVFSRMANAVIVCTHAQAAWARQFNRNVSILHIVIDPAPYRAHSKSYATAPEKPVIGWLGTGPEHLANLPLLVPVLRRLAEDDTQPFVFVLVGAFGDDRVYRLFRDIPGLEVRFVDRLDYTDLESAPKEIGTFDIGVVPHQREGAWNEGKTSMKVLEYMACAVPAIVSDFGEMHYVIEDDVNGYIAASEDEWVTKLSQLLRDRSLRQRLGEAGQSTVQERFSFDAVLPKVVQLIETV